MPPLGLDFGMVDNEIGDEIAGLQEQWTCYYEQVHTVTDLLRSKLWSLNKITTIFHTTKRNSQQSLCALACAMDEKRLPVVADKGTIGVHRDRNSRRLRSTGASHLLGYNGAKRLTKCLRKPRKCNTPTKKLTDITSISKWRRRIETANRGTFIEQRPVKTLRLK
jgi:hypothetical protein